MNVKFPIQNPYIEEFYNKCHVQSGENGGQFCSGGTVSEPQILNATSTKKIHKELLAQGLDPKVDPLFDVTSYAHGNRTVLARNKEGKIVGALTYRKDRSGITLTEIRIQTDQKRTGFGTELVRAAAKDALTIKGKDNQKMIASGTVQDAVPFHQKLGAVYYREHTSNVEGSPYRWNSRGEYSPEATKALAEGKPLEDNRIDVNDDSKFDPIYGYPKDHNPYAGESYDRELKYYLEQKALKASASVTEFHQQGTHDQTSHGNWATGSDEYDYPRADDMDDVSDATEQVEKHYGRKEMAPEMGGIQWAFEGGSPPITEAAQDVLQGYDYDPYDRFLAYDRSSHQAAQTILRTLEDESSDVTLYSGHKRSREYVNSLLADGNVEFPLVATSPDKDLADIYAGSKENTGDTIAVVYEFPPGSQAGFYQFNEHIATGEYEVESHRWYDDNVVDIKLRQTKRNQVPELNLPEEEE